MNTLPHTLSPGTFPLAPRPLDLARLTGAAAWQQLSPAIRRRFAADHVDRVYRGHLDLHASAIGRAFAWLTRPLASPLVGTPEAAAPAEVRVHGDGAGGVVWERRLVLAQGRRTQTVRSVKRLDADGGLEERTGCGLAMQLDVSVEHGALVFRSRRYVLALGRLRLPIPPWLTPGTCRVEHRDEGPGRFRFTLEMVHPLWGRTFFQSGLFDDPEEFQP